MKKILFGALCASVLLASCSSKEEGTINGVFSVSETQKVKFSSGNFQYEKATKTCKFADHQWDVVLGDKGYGSDTYEKAEVLDMFSWGTGDNPRIESLKPESTFTDWGTNKIVNGGNDPWRTLTSEEWVFLLQKRANALSLLAYVMVDNSQGIILLPDDWKLPEGAKFASLADTAKNVGGDIKINKMPREADLTKLNAYSVADWAKMENAGAVFIPFTRWYSNNETPVYGYYWTADGKQMYFQHNTIYAKGTSDCTGRQRGDYYYKAVRLVKDVK